MSRAGDFVELSDLTEPLLMLILSFLSLKEAGRSSVVSKQWRNLSHERQYVVFDENDFIGGTDFDIQTQRRKFFDICIRWTLSFPNLSRVRNFRLVTSDPQHYVDDVQRLIDFAVSHNVESLDLDFSNLYWLQQHGVGHFSLPEKVYRHAASLKSLRLLHCTTYTGLFKEFSLLESLSLGWMELTSASFRDLLSKSPILVNLILEKCTNLDGIHVVSPNLRTLSILNCRDLDSGIETDTPDLRSFKYSGSCVPFTIGYWPRVKEVELDFGNQLVLVKEHGDRLASLLGDLFACKILTVCSYMLQVLPGANSEYPPSLPQLNHLTLNTSLHCHELHGITYLLKRCPNLQVLTIELVDFPRIFSERVTQLSVEDQEFKCRSADVCVYECVRHSLRRVQMNGFRGRRNEKLMLQYLLNFGEQLECVDIVASRERGPGFEERHRDYWRSAHDVVSGCQSDLSQVRINIL